MPVCKEIPTTVTQHFTLARASIAKEASVAEVVETHTLMTTCQMAQSPSKDSVWFRLAESLYLYSTAANLHMAE